MVITELQHQIQEGIVGTRLYRRSENVTKKIGDCGFVGNCAANSNESKGYKTWGYGLQMEDMEVVRPISDISFPRCA